MQFIPENAKYTSPEIQSEIIKIMAFCVKSAVSADIRTANVPIFCIIADGTWDGKNAEAICIVIRFVKNGVPTESLFDIVEAQDPGAENLTNLILQTSDDNQVNSENLLGQCYDGAVVINGCRGGVAFKH